LQKKEKKSHWDHLTVMVFVVVVVLFIFFSAPQTSSKLLGAQIHFTHSTFVLAENKHKSGWCHVILIVVVVFPSAQGSGERRHRHQ